MNIKLSCLALLCLPALAAAQVTNVTDVVVQPLNLIDSGVVLGGGACPTTPTVIYDTTHASTQGAEITAAANGSLTCMGDLVTLAVATQRQVCEVQVEVFTLASVDPFDLTVEFYTDCTTSGVAGSACGVGSPGVLIPGSTMTVSNIVPPAVGAIFAVSIPYPTTVDLSGEADNTVSVKLSASRDDVFWRIDETPAVGSLPAGEPATSFVERCGSSGGNNGCQRNFGVNNNFSIKINAIDGAPAAAVVSGTKTVTGSFQPGGAVTYSVVLNNAGLGAQADNPGDEFTDVLPASLVLTSASASSGTALATIGTNTVTWNGAIPASGSTTITINATVSPGATPGASVDNQGTISFDGDGNGTNESSASTDDPAVGGAADPTSFVIAGSGPGPVTPVDLPASGVVAKVAIGGLLAMLGFVALRRRKQSAK